VDIGVQSAGQEASDRQVAPPPPPCLSSAVYSRRRDTTDEDDDVGDLTMKFATLDTFVCVPSLLSSNSSYEQATTSERTTGLSGNVRFND